MLVQILIVPIVSCYIFKDSKGNFIGEGPTITTDEKHSTSITFQQHKAAGKNDNDEMNGLLETSGGFLLYKDENSIISKTRKDLEKAIESDSADVYNYFFKPKKVKEGVMKFEIGGECITSDGGTLLTLGPCASKASAFTLTENLKTLKEKNEKMYKNMQNELNKLKNYLKSKKKEKKKVNSNDSINDQSAENEDSIKISNFLEALNNENEKIKPDKSNEEKVSNKEDSSKIANFFKTFFNEKNNIANPQSNPNTNNNRIPNSLFNNPISKGANNLRQISRPLAGAMPNLPFSQSQAYHPGLKNSMPLLPNRTIPNSPFNLNRTTLPPYSPNMLNRMAPNMPMQQPLMNRISNLGNQPNFTIPQNVPYRSPDNLESTNSNDKNEEEFNKLLMLLIAMKKGDKKNDDMIDMLLYQSILENGFNSSPRSRENSNKMLQTLLMMMALDKNNESTELEVSKNKKENPEDIIKFYLLKDKVQKIERELEMKKAANSKNKKPANKSPLGALTGLIS